MAPPARSFAPAAPLALVALLATACTGTRNATVTSTQACVALAQARCAQSSTCAFDTFASRWADEASCEAAETALCNARLVAPGTGDDTYAIGACADVYAQDGGFSCAAARADQLPAACQPRSGLLEPGAACAFDSQCRTAYCRLAPGAVCGECGTAPVAGDSCAALASCGASLACNARGRCVVPSNAQYPCDPATLPCAAGLFCAGASATSAGHCAAAAQGADAGCDPTGQSAPACDPGLGLVCAGGSCAAAAYAHAGEACGDDVGGRPVRCAASGACIAGVCVAAVAAGAACDVAKGPPCAYPAQCVVASGTAGTCRAPDGRACASARDE